MKTTCGAGWPGSTNMPEISTHELAVKRENETLDLIDRTRRRLTENDERWTRMEAAADACFNDGQARLAQQIASEAYDLRIVSQRLRRDLNQMYQELERLRAWLSQGS